MHGIAEDFSECVWVEGFNLSSDGNEARERGSEKIERKSSSFQELWLLLEMQWHSLWILDNVYTVWAAERQISDRSKRDLNF